MDPYSRYVPAPPLPERAEVGAAHASYVPEPGLPIPSHSVWGTADVRGTPDILQNEVLASRPDSYALDNLAAIGRLPATGLGGVAAGAGVRGYSPLEDPALLRRDAAFGLEPDIADIERVNSVVRSKAPPVEDSNILFVDGLPTDCTRREVGHLFRPFIGFKEIRVIHKEPRHSGDKPHVLCFVEFTDAKCASTALEALQGYKFDDKKPDTPVLKIQFAKFPFRPALIHDDRRKPGNAP